MVQNSLEKDRVYTVVLAPAVPYRHEHMHDYGTQSQCGSVLMSARSSRFSGFGSSRRGGKAAGAVIASGVMLLAGCGGSVTGGEATDAPSAIVRGDTLGRDWESTYPTVDASAGQVVVSWDKQITEDATESVVGYEVQISSSMYGPWIGAATGCARSETKSSTRQKCTATGLADGTYYFNVAAVRQPVINKDKTGNFSRDTKTGNFSAGSPPAIVLSPPGTPAKPTAVAGTGTGEVTVTVAAGTATDGTQGGIPTSYTITAYTGGGTATAMTCTGTACTGLADTSYTFTATATNAAGTSVLPSAVSDPVTTAGYVLGSTGPGGGKVFYVSKAGFTSSGSGCGAACHYLEAQTADLAKSPWCSNTTQDLPGKFGGEIGKGYLNTQNMVNMVTGCTTGAGIAAATSRLGSVSDWYLPSANELYALLHSGQSVGGFEQGCYYWSSTQEPSHQEGVAFATIVRYPSGSGSAQKSYSECVRPVRVF